MQSDPKDVGVLQGGVNKADFGGSVRESSRFDEGHVRELRDIACAGAWKVIRQRLRDQQNEEESVAVKSPQVRQQCH